MSEKVKVGLIGIGGMGRTHFGCYQNNPNAEIVAICDVDAKKREGDWGNTALNIDTGEAGAVDLSGIAVYENYEDLIADENVQLVDICLPTRLHAPATLAALKAGKDTLCEKPLAFDESEGEQMVSAFEESGKQLLIGHCLRYWSHYIKAKEIIDSGEYGRVLSARFHRVSGTPWWSFNNWLATGSESGGAILDMHIHDVDTALWWFGEPSTLTADGVIEDGLPLSVDAIWRYENGPVVYLHGAWDNNGGDFDYGFKVVLEKATLVHHPVAGVADLKVIKGGRDGDQSEVLELDNSSAYQNEIDDYVDCLHNGKTLTRVTPQDSLRTLRVCLEELRQVQEKNR
jgi:predicted dehydrogenase